MKKFLALSFALAMALSLAACGSKTEQPSTGSNSGDAETTGFIPSKNITWIVTSSAGGGSDIITRKLAEILTNEDLVNGQTIVVSNETDGGGEIGRNKVANMKAGDADYTLLNFGSGDMTAMVDNTKNRVANFRILAVMAQDKQLMFSCPASDAKTDYAKAGGDQENFAAAIEAAKNGTFVVIGGSKGDDIATYNKLLKEIGLTEQQMGYITYDSTSDAITAALGGNVDFVISKPAAASQYVESGDLHAVLALSSERYGGSLADAPTLSEIGDYNNVEVPVWRAVAAPAAMSDEAVDYWSDVLGKVAETQEWKDGYLSKYQLIDSFMPADTATAFVTEYEANYLAENSK